MIKLKPSSALHLDENSIIITLALISFNVPKAGTLKMTYNKVTLTIFAFIYG